MNSPIPPEGASAPDAATSTDAFLRGAFHLVQPAGRGFRAGHDALLLAACVGDAMAGRALDMGAGSGAVAFAAACRADGIHLDLAERNAEIAALAERSRRLSANAALAGRLAVRVADLLSPRAAREAAGLRDGAYDLVLTNPPFHPAGQRRSPDPLRDEARAIPGADFLARWIAVAAALLRPGGRLALIGRPENLRDLLPAADNRFGSLRLLAVHRDVDAPASRILLGAVAGSREPIRILPPLVLDAEMRERISLGCHHIRGILDEA
ncbi:tRNA1(Val) (adenine(37)-N6)-methyltransferase [Aureimonas sp. AU12]|uniref:tRNA1(Val) (adenine(37)-N6)-methyltransferase n=1 Tax=Aureimonas sp. AU12 TaxID=1638161 RepID=UPI0007848079|nr:methyltransferase [Aureimonas sp. AU12]